MRATTAGCCALVLGLMVGCLAMQTKPKKPITATTTGKPHYATGSPKAVAQRAQNLLETFGVTAVEVPDGSAVCLRCVTAAHGHFVLRFVDAKTPDGGERTQVSLDWEDGHDDRLGIQVMAGLGILENL